MLKGYGKHFITAFSFTLGIVVLAGLLLMTAPSDTALTAAKETPSDHKPIIESTRPASVFEPTRSGSVFESVPVSATGRPEDVGPAQEVLGENGSVAETAALTMHTGALIAPTNDAYTYQVTPAVPGAVTLCFAGDILMDNGYANMARMRANGSTIEGVMDETMLTYMRSADVMMVNNEFPFTDRGAPLSGKTFTFHAKTEWVHYLNDMGVDIAGLANNHAYDYGEIGLTDTLDTIRSAGIITVGAGRNIEEASHPVYLNVTDPATGKPFTVSIIAATQIERMQNPSTKGATATSPGVFRCVDVEPLLEQVRLAKATSDYCIVFIHWGTEKKVESDWAQNEQAPKIAEAGADLIIGAHPHILQKIEYIGDTPVVYSLGNYWFNSSTLNTCLITATITKDGLFDLRFVPAVQKNCTVNYAAGESGQKIINYMNTLSTNATIAPDGKIGKR